MQISPASHGIRNRWTSGESFSYTAYILLVIGLTLSSTGFAQQHDAPMSHDPAHMEHDESGHALARKTATLPQTDIVAQENILPSQVGQSAFFAIAEIVEILENDPDTDWAAVDIDALRSHLVDMDHITLNASTETLQVDEQQIHYVITGKDDTLTAIRRMVPAHASVVQNMTHWTITTTQQADGATVSIKTGDKAALTRLKALGFHGFLTIGAHHQAHHLQMARGVGH